MNSAWNLDGSRITKAAWVKKQDEQERKQPDIFGNSQ